MSYDALRHFADSWGLVFMGASYAVLIGWHFRPRDASIAGKPRSPFSRLIMRRPIMADDKRIDAATGTEIKHHEWDGIQELDTPLPRWWLWTFYATILFAIGYVIAYPALPMLHRATVGVLGWSSRGALDKELAAREAQIAPVRQAIADTSIEVLPTRPQLMQAAVEGGRAAFRVHCVQCHGSGAAGSKGYPNLNDDDWLWGGDLPTIEKTITDGVRNPDHAATRQSLMPAFGKDQLLTAAQVDDVVAHVRVISGQDRPGPASQRGAKVFADNCAVCHGPAGKGNSQGWCAEPDGRDLALWW